MLKQFDYIIVGAGIIGLVSAYTLIKKDKNLKIAVFEKENDVAQHASGRNSGVVHAGIYYAKDSLKAQYCINGGNKLIQYCNESDLKINQCGKLIVAKEDTEIKPLIDLFENAKRNGSVVDLIDEKQVSEIDPCVKTSQKAIWSPDTASINPISVCESLKNNLIESGVEFFFNTEVFSINVKDSIINAVGKSFIFGFLLNTAGLYADKISNFYGLCLDYQLLPFKGYYLVANSRKLALKTHVYPVPNSKFPFLGVHFTITNSGNIKIGPTAVPALWKEQYDGVDNFSLREMCDITKWYTSSLARNSFGFRGLLLKEARYLFRKNLILEAGKLVKEKIDPKMFSKSRPGIRAQLFDKREKRLVNDFLIKKKNNSLHVLNAVSPAFTCAFAMAENIVKECYT